MKNKHLLTATVILLSSFHQAPAQDVIILNSGERIEAKVLAVDSANILYVAAGQPDSVQAKVPVNEARGIRYSDNTIREFVIDGSPVTPPQTKAPEGPSQDMHQRGIDDSKSNYTAKNSGAESVKISTLIITPFLGFIPAIAFAAPMPSNKNMNYPDPELLQNASYKKAYRKTAHQTKRKAVWSAYGEATGMWFLAIGKAVVYIFTFPFKSSEGTSEASSGNTKQETTQKPRNSPAGSTTPPPPPSPSAAPAPATSEGKNTRSK